ncbi:uncharacterized protein TRAVEDRAFT_53146 [Trametes versicolor FP-101664 SS1]|uniref:uncharacterized protein n=1 Tax=Trametes versicolor (strain FP-101664) TaxID=717944 RepID=UPI0004623B9F|nr:uncharacterized protein TRAVEDRAFT_53146 [Trametes versicolor FP-101664 SS1]EIW52706.1 hypothetical protein TRAVEDRAFT_53146 [Trametes versicolor FP-101664 SS1]
MRLSFAPVAYALVALTLAPYTIQTGFITAFTGAACDGDAGGNVTCDGSCHTFGARHSFRVDPGSGPHCMTLYIDAGCLAHSEGFTLTGQEGGCQNVNTGTDIQSFICAPSNICLV